MDDLQNELSTTRLLVRSIYGAVLAYAGILYFKVLPVASNVSLSKDLLFVLFSVGGALLFGVTLVLGEKLLGHSFLADQAASAPAGSKRECLSGRVRTGAIILAGLGETLGIFGLVFYFLTGDASRAWTFIGMSAVHYFISRSKIIAASQSLTELTREA